MAALFYTNHRMIDVSRFFNVWKQKFAQIRERQINVNARDSIDASPMKHGRKDPEDYQLEPIDDNDDKQSIDYFNEHASDSSGVNKQESFIDED